MNVPRQIALGTTVLIAVTLAGAGFGAGYVVGRQEEKDQSAASQYAATVVSLYPDKTGGCLRPASDSGVAAATPDGSCGPFFWQSGVTPSIGGAVQVVEVPAQSSDGEDLMSFLLSPEG